MGLTGKDTKPKRERRKRKIGVLIESGSELSEADWGKQKQQMGTSEIFKSGKENTGISWGPWQRNRP